MLIAINYRRKIMKFISFANPKRVFSRKKIMKAFTEPQGKDISYVLEKTAASKETVFEGKPFNEKVFQELLDEGAIVETSEGTYYFNEGYYKKIRLINALPILDILSVWGDNRIVKAFKEAKATSPETAKTLSDMGINTGAMKGGKANFDSMTHYGTIKRVPNTLRFYLDDEKYGKQKIRDGIIGGTMTAVVLGLLVWLIIAII